jgi:uncharacterized membrane protein YhaH (DUF805 family)
MNNIISNYMGFEGRLNRQPFWISAIILAVVSIVISLVILPLIGLGIMPAMPTIDANTTAADVANVIGAARSKAGWVSLVLFLIFLYPSAALSIKRRHDRNNNGLDVWIYLGLTVIVQLISALGIGMTTMDVGGTAIPVPGPITTGLGIIVGIYAIYLLVVLGFLKGTAGPNNYGPDPLQG